MDEKLKAFLDEKKAVVKKKEEKKKNELLIELGLFEKVYSEENKQSAEFPYYEDGWFKQVPITVSDEELKKCEPAKCKKN